MKFKIVLILIFFPVILFAQEPLHYWKKPAEFIEEQSIQTINLVKELLNQSPPSINIDNTRKSALLHLDWIFHDPRLDNSIVTERFLQSQVRGVVNELNKPIKKGVKIIKMYNHGFIVKSPTVTIAFDLTRAGQGEKKPMISDELMDSVVKMCDVLFISHIHGDHADSQVGDLFIKNNKNIIATTGIWKDKGKGVKHFRSEEIIKEKVFLNSGKELKVTIMPGHQDEVPNNVYLVTTPEGINIAHTGDQFNEKDKWIDTVKEIEKVDVLLVHCWAMPLEKIVDGFNPKLVVSGHENEIVHSIDHREPYWLNYRRMAKVNKPVVYMTWGESYLFKN